MADQQGRCIKVPVPVTPAQSLEQFFLLLPVDFRKSCLTIDVFNELSFEFCVIIHYIGLEFTVQNSEK